MSDRVHVMSILVTISVNLGESVTLRDLRQFVQTANQNGADPDVDLREYDDNDNLIGLAAVGELESDGDAAEGNDAVEDDAVEDDAVEDDAVEADGRPSPATDIAVGSRFAEVDPG